MLEIDINIFLSFIWLGWNPKNRKILANVTTLAKDGSRYHKVSCFMGYQNGSLCLFKVAIFFIPIPASLLWEFILFYFITEQGWKFDSLFANSNWNPQGFEQGKVICWSKRFPFSREGLELTKKVWSEICIICSYTLTGCLAQFSPCLSIESIEKMGDSACLDDHCNKNTLTRRKKSNCFKVFYRLDWINIEQVWCLCLLDDKKNLTKCKWSSEICIICR